MKERFCDWLKECDHFQREGFLLFGRSVPNLEDMLIGLIIAKLQAGHQERERLKLKRGSGFPDGLGYGWS
jgi:hypothetical protein